MSTDISYTTIQFFAIAAGLLVAILEVTAAVILFRVNRTPGAMMFVGALISFLPLIGGPFIQFLIPPHKQDFLITLIMAVSALGAFGSLLFAAGLLLHALNCKGLQARITELEAILTPDDKS